MFLLGLDYETTGLEHDTDRVIEVGAVVWDIKARAPVHFHSEFVLGENWPIPTDEAKEVTGIEPDWVRKFHIPEQAALSRIEGLAKECNFAVAHNAEMEMGFTRNWINRQPNVNGFSSLLKIPWIDTMIHLPFGPRIKVKDLVSLCSHHGFFNPHPHRALWDTWAMMKMLDIYADKFDEIVANSQAPRAKVWSRGITFNTKDLPKSLGYYWDGGTKRWWLPVKESELDDAINKAKAKGFEVETETQPICTTIGDLEKIRAEQSGAV